MDKREHVEALCERLNEHMEVVEEILEEIRVELQWGVRNGRIRIVSMAADPCARDMRINEANQPTYCPDCDTEVPSLAEAIRQGWTDLRERDGGFVGTCPECVANNNDLADADTRDAETTESVSDVTKCDTCDAEATSPPQALKDGWDSFRKADDHHRGRCPSCQDDQKIEKGRLF